MGEICHGGTIFITICLSINDLIQQNIINILWFNNIKWLTAIFFYFFLQLMEHGQPGVNGVSVMASVGKATKDESVLAQIQSL